MEKQTKVQPLREKFPGRWTDVVVSTWQHGSHKCWPVEDVQEGVEQAKDLERAGEAGNSQVGLGWEAGPDEWQFQHMLIGHHDLIEEDAMEIAANIDWMLKNGEWVE